MAKVLVNESSLTGIADAIRGKNGTTDTYKPSEMAAAITAISGGGEPTIEALSITANGTYTAPDGVDGYSPVTVNVPQDGGPPDSDFVLSGDLSYWDYNGEWDSFIEAYINKWSTSNIVDASYMFYHTKLTSIPFDINLSSSYPRLAAIFSESYLTVLPKIVGNNITIQRTKYFLNNAYIKNIPDDYFNFIGNVYDSWTNVSFMFSGAIYLRNFPSSVNIIPQKSSHTYYLYSFYRSMCDRCYVLDEINNLGVATLSTLTGNAFYNAFESCSRLKNITFESGKTVNWKNQTIELSSYVGYANDSSQINDITADKQVTDDATYQALKDDPDWWTTNVAYSRYNHDSAVATINSLPDASAYLASDGGTNTIMFKGDSGSATDGGAISSLTPEEIAVATSRGWTVTLI